MFRQNLWSLDGVMFHTFILVTSSLTCQSLSQVYTDTYLFCFVFDVLNARQLSIWFTLFVYHHSSDLKLFFLIPQHLNVKSYGGATWVRVYVQGSAPFRASDVVYVLSYPHTPILIACRMKVKMQDIMFSVSWPHKGLFFVCLYLVCIASRLLKSLLAQRKTN